MTSTDTAGMSTRAIAAVVDVSAMTVSSDLRSGVKPFTPADADDDFVPSEHQILCGGTHESAPAHH